MFALRIPKVQKAGETLSQAVERLRREYPLALAIEAADEMPAPVVYIASEDLADRALVELLLDNPEAVPGGASIAWLDGAGELARHVSDDVPVLVGKMRDRRERSGEVVAFPVFGKPSA